MCEVSVSSLPPCLNVILYEQSCVCVCLSVCSRACLCMCLHVTKQDTGLHKVNLVLFIYIFFWYNVNVRGVCLNVTAVISSIIYSNCSEKSCQTGRVSVLW